MQQDKLVVDHVKKIFWHQRGAGDISFTVKDGSFSPSLARQVRQDHDPAHPDRPLAAPDRAFSGMGRTSPICPSQAGYGDRLSELCAL